MPRTPLRTFSEHSGIITAVAFSPDGRTASAAGWQSNSFELWGLATGELILSFSVPLNPVAAIGFSPDGRTLVAGAFNKYGTLTAGDRNLSLWDVASGRKIQEFPAIAVSAVAFSPDGRMIVSVSDGGLQTWDVVAGGTVRSIEGSKNAYLDYSPLAVSPDGHTALATGEISSSPILWELTTGKAIHTLSGHSAAVSSIVFSPDGKRALSGSSDKTLKLWDLSAGNVIRTFSGHSGPVTGVAISPDGRTALSGGGDDRTLKLWDVATGKMIRSIVAHWRGVSSVAFSPDGRRALSGGADETLKLWDIPERT